MALNQRAHPFHLLVEDSRNISARMAAAGFSEDETRGAWNYARQPGYTEATGLGQDRLDREGREGARYLQLARPWSLH